jgi:hypothetical protein
LPSLSGIKSKAKGLASKAKNAIFGGKLEKAFVVRYKKTGDSYRVGKKIQVQFNPAEYSVRRGVRHSSKKALGRDTSSSEIQTVSAEPSHLSLSLYFDSYTELKGGDGLAFKAADKVGGALKGKYNSLVSGTFLPSFDMNEEMSPSPNYLVNQRFEEFLELIKYNPEEHEPPHVGFIWGDSIFFVGKVVSQSTSYTIFDKDGTPVRAKLDMTIVGEDVAFDNAEYPMESPDRTKQRTLYYGDQLWMMAQEEYGDVAHWKTIAEANGILNPRKVDRVVRLKVPSIR